MSVIDSCNTHSDYFSCTRSRRAGLAPPNEIGGVNPTLQNYRAIIYWNAYNSAHRGLSGGIYWGLQ